MRDLTKPSKDEGVRFLGRAVCVVLALFLLYNPFFTICPASGPAATIQHHISYRSTLAASELGCSNLQHPEVSVEPVIALFVAQLDSVRSVADVTLRPCEETVAATDGFAPPLWSRPPPTL